MNNTYTASDLSMYRPFFRAALKRANDWFAEYEADVDAWYADGDGAPANWVTEVDEEGEVYHYNAGGRGYSYPNCIHGMSRWTDYDNICGGCEDGWTAVQLAQNEARASFTRYQERMAWFVAAPSSIPQEMKNELLSLIFKDARL